jgi:hypothetical protein
MFDLDVACSGFNEPPPLLSPGLVAQLTPGSLILDDGTVADLVEHQLQLALAHGANYVEASPADGTVSANGDGFSAGGVPLWLLVTDGPTRRLVSARDCRGMIGVPAGA